MQQLLTIQMQVSSSASTSKSTALAGQRKVKVDRIAAFLRPCAASDGTLPTRDQIQAVEDSITLKLWRDNGQTLALIPQGVPLRALQSRDMGPLPIQPFELTANDQPTVEWSALSSNVFGASGPFAAASAWYLSVVFYATDDRA